jgi:hypothetical protein
MRKPGAGPLLKEFARNMAGRAGPAGAHDDFSRLVFGGRDKVGQRLHGDGRMHDQNNRRAAQSRNRCEVLDRIVLRR